MDFRFAAYDPQTGDFLYSLPRPSEVQIGDVFGSRGTLSLTFSKAAPNYRDMPTFVEVRAEVAFGNGAWEPVGPSYLRLSGDHEDTDQAQMRKREFVGPEWLLGKARVGEGELPLIDGKRPFYRATPGEIMRTLILEAQDRGAAQGIDISTISNAQDSAGTSWDRVATIYYSPGLPIGSVLENLVDQGMCDYRIEGRTLLMYEPETEMGRDLTTGTNPVRIHAAISEAPVKYTVEDVVNSALLIGDDGFKLEVNNPSAPDDYGRLETTIEQGGVSDPGTARLMVDEALQKGSREIREITRTQTASQARFLPYRDYRVGDYVQVLTDGEWRRYRVRELQLTRDGNEWTVHVVLNDRLQELLLRLAKRTSGIVNGSSGSGGDGTRPSPEFPPGVEPAAPHSLVIDQQVYLDDSGTARGQITASWAPVTEGVTGQPVRVGGYELWSRKNETGEKWQRQTTTDDTTANHSPVVLTNPDGTAAAYQWRVRALAEASNRPSQWSNTVTLTMTQDTEAPPAPSTPGVSTEFRSIMVEWDTLDHEGYPMPRDFSRAPIYFGTDQAMSNAYVAGSLTYAGVWTSGTMPADVPVYVAMTAVDRVGNESGMTTPVMVTPKQLVDDGSIRDAIEEAKRDAIDEAVTTAGGRSVHNKTTTPVASPDDEEHDVWQQWTTLDDGGTLLGVWVHDGTRWVAGDMEEQYVARVNIGEGTFGELSGGRLKSNTVETDALIVGISQNMVPDPGFVNPETSAQRLSAANLYGATAGIDDGILWFDVPASQASNMNISLAATSDLYAWPAYPSMKLVVRATVRADDYAQFRFTVRYRTRGGATAHVTMSPTTHTATADWLEYASTFDMPSDAASYSAVIQVQATSSGRVEFRAPLAAPMVGSTLIEPGGIKTPNLASNAVTADTIAGGAIDGKVITGATVRTNESGARVQMNPTGLYAYNPSNEQTFSISSVTGAVNMEGNLTQYNSYGNVAVGPNLYNDSDTSPAISFGQRGTTRWGYPGILLRGTGSSEQLTIQGSLTGDQTGSVIRLPVDGNSLSTGMWRMFGTNRSSYVTLAADGGAFLASRGANAEMVAYTSTGSSARSWVWASNLGSVGLTNTSDASIFVNSGGDANVNAIGSAYVQAHASAGDRRGSLSITSSGVGLHAGQVGGQNVNKDLYLVAYGSSFMQARTTGNTLRSYLDLTVNGRVFLGGDNISLDANIIYMPSLPNDSGAVPIGRISGLLHSISSSRKYKILEEPISEDTTDRLLDVDPKTWIDRTRAERVADHLTAVTHGEEPTEDLDKIGGFERIPGVIAEDLHDAGLGMFVTYKDGEPESVMYDRIGPALIPIIRRLRDRVDALETRLGATA